MLNRAPATPQRRPAFTDNAGLLTDFGVQVLTEMRKQIAPGFPVVPVKITGTNALTLTPTLDSEGGATYGNGMVWRGIPPNTSTGSLTAVVAGPTGSTNKTLKVYKGDGATQAGSGDIVKNQLYDFVYEAALNGGAGGWFLIQPLGSLLSVISSLVLGAGFLKLGAGPAASLVSVGGSLVLQPFATSVTYTPTTGMLFTLLGTVGGGAGGGGCAASAAGNQSAGGSGGGGSTSLKLVSAATIGASQTVTIGAAANGGTSGNNAGTDGNDTSIGSLCIGKGGTHGNGAAAASSALGGAGGVVGTGDITIPGAAGGNGMAAAIVTVNQASGNGGSSGLGFGAGGIGVRAANGTAGSNYGGGGSGGESEAGSGAASGGAGAQGFAFALELVAA
jgi:hypothetical protein